MNRNTGGIGFFGLLTIVFIVLKLTNTITWSWFWALLPITWPIILMIIGGIPLFIKWLYDAVFKP